MLLNNTNGTFYPISQKSLNFCRTVHVRVKKNGRSRYYKGSSLTLDYVKIWGMRLLLMWVYFLEKNSSRPSLFLERFESNSNVTVAQ